MCDPLQKGPGSGADPQQEGWAQEGGSVTAPSQAVT